MPPAMERRRDESGPAVAIIVIVVLAIVAAYLLLRSSGERAQPGAPPVSCILIDARSEDAYAAEYLVEPTVTRDEVLNLAEYLREQYRPRVEAESVFVIDVFDDRTALLRRADPEFPPEQVDRHWLVQIDFRASPEGLIRDKLGAEGWAARDRR